MNRLIPKEREAVKKLKRGKPADITAADYATVHNRCAEEWPRDFGVREYCEQKEFDAIRKLRDQKPN